MPGRGLFLVIIGFALLVEVGGGPSTSNPGSTRHSRIRRRGDDTVPVPSTS
ncbi:hypothetical protein [Actinokineospora enzanensis]|uniref:hypothetical protein n=1 Tax=Actinokineospora enzanensis TaxID=155975 RepID=UPI0003726692|nr:hypothetical protein [Actinokineospora enzanensis]